MSGKKQKHLRKLARILGADMPEASYKVESRLVKEGEEVHRVVLKDDTQRALNKRIKRLYARGQR